MSIYGRNVKPYTVLTIDYLDRLVEEVKYSWNDNLIICCKKNNAAMAKYCISKGAKNYIPALSTAYEYKAYNVIDLLITNFADNVNHYFTLICFQHRYDIIVSLLKTYDTIKLESLRYILKLDANVLFDIIMAKPFKITRHHFGLKNHPNTIYSRLDVYNNDVLTKLKLFMCNDIASIVASYSYL